MESLTESGVVWSLLLEQDSQPLQWYLERFTDAPAGAEPFFGRGSEEIPAVSVSPAPAGPCDRPPSACDSSLGPTTRGPRTLIIPEPKFFGF